MGFCTNSHTYTTKALIVRNAWQFSVAKVTQRWADREREKKPTTKCGFVMMMMGKKAPCHRNHGYILTHFPQMLCDYHLVFFGYFFSMSITWKFDSVQHLGAERERGRQRMSLVCKASRWKVAGIMIITILLVSKTFYTVDIRTLAIPSTHRQQTQMPIIYVWWCIIFSLVGDTIFSFYSKMYVLWIECIGLNG